MVEHSKISMKILLTGGTGQLGKTILDQFADCEFYVLNRGTMDFAHQESILSVVSEFVPDVIINAAAWTNVEKAEICPEETLQINLGLVEMLVHANASVGARIIQISTDYVFDGQNSIPYVEDSLKNPLSVYGLSKSLAEDFLLSEYPKNSFIVRTSWLYSKHRSNFVKTILKTLMNDDRHIEVVSDQFGSPTLAKDLSYALSLLCEGDYEPGVYHFANSGVASWHSFAHTLAEYANQDPKRVIPVETTALKNLVRRPTYSVLNTSKFSAATGHTPPSWRESLMGEISGIRREIERELKSEI
jgi:dTDP-4-dehydrorhamnose reductase